jgi:hypothetical protein
MQYSDPVDVFDSNCGAVQMTSLHTVKPLESVKLLEFTGQPVFEQMNDPSAL